MISIGISTGAMNTGAPGGKKKPKKCTPWRTNATIVTIKKTEIASPKVTMICPVNVKLYGISPIKLPNNTNMKIEKINGKNSMPSVPTFSRTMPATNS